MYLWKGAWNGLADRGALRHHLATDASTFSKCCRNVCTIPLFLCPWFPFPMVKKRSWTYGRTSKARAEVKLFPCKNLRDIWSTWWNQLANLSCPKIERSDSFTGLFLACLRLDQGNWVPHRGLFPKYRPNLEIRIIYDLFRWAISTGTYNKEITPRTRWTTWLLDSSKADCNTLHPQSIATVQLDNV